MEEGCSPGTAYDVCWFCRKGRHNDCMKKIPVEGRSEGPHDCSFDTQMVACKCKHCGEQ